jgi:hypothetical protein
MVLDGDKFVFQDRLHAMSISGGCIIDSDSQKAQIVDVAAKLRELSASEQQAALRAMLQALDIQEIARARRIVVHRPKKRKQKRRAGKSERKRQARRMLLPPLPGPPARGRGDSAAVALAESEIRMWGGSAWGAENDGGAGERARRLQAQRTEAEAEVEAQQRQQAALRILNTILRCANGEDPRALRNARELEALDADTQGYSFTGPEAAELELECAKRAEEARASACSRRYTLEKALASTGLPAFSTDDFGSAVPLLFPQHQELGEGRRQGVPLAVASVLTYLQEANAGSLAKILLANSPPPREWGVGAHAATQGAV